MSNAQHPLITEWYEVERQRPLPTQPDAIVVTGFPLWGDAFARRFLDFTLPSIRANRAFPTAVDLVVYVDQPTQHLLPPDVRARIIPDDVMRIVRAEPGYKYTLLTAVHLLLAERAARKGAGFSMSTADAVYAERFFERLIDLGRDHDAVAMLALISSETRAGPDLLARRRGDVLALSGCELGTLGWRHISGLMRSWVMTGVETFPAAHVLLWQGLDAIHIRCPHLTPIWLGPERCRALPTGLGVTLDALGDAYLGPAFYVPKASDDMTVLTLDDTRDAPVGRVSLAAFAEGIRPFAGCMAQFRAPCVIPTEPAVDGLPDDEIERQFNTILERLTETRP